MTVLHSDFLAGMPIYQAKRKYMLSLQLIGELQAYSEEYGLSQL